MTRTKACANRALHEKKSPRGKLHLSFVRAVAFLYYNIVAHKRISTFLIVIILLLPFYFCTRAHGEIYNAIWFDELLILLNQPSLLSWCPWELCCIRVVGVDWDSLLIKMTRWQWNSNFYYVVMIEWNTIEKDTFTSDKKWFQQAVVAPACTQYLHVSST